MQPDSEASSSELCPLGTQQDAPRRQEPAAGFALSEAWELLSVAVRERVQPEQFETWFRRAALAGLDDTCVRIAVQNNFSRDWLRAYYLDALGAAVAATFGAELRVELEVDPELTLARPLLTAVAADDQAAPQGRGHRNGSSNGHAGSERNGTGPLGASRPLDPGSIDGAAAHRGADRIAARASVGPSPGAASPGTSPGASAGHEKAGLGSLVRGSDVGLNPKYTFENFVVGPCNRFAYAAAMGAAETPGKAYNPFFLHGYVGLGKTHLLQSLCYTLLESTPGVRILYLSCETFVNHFINALENGNLERFRNKYRNVDVLVVDDIHLLANKDRTQEEFFHTFNTLYNAGAQIVLSSDSPPKDIPTLQERLVSRFKWGLVTEIEPPCFETRMAILKRKSRERGHELDDEVAKLLAERIDTNIRELEGAITKLLTFADVSNQPVSTQLARTILGELFAVRRGQPTMDDIISAVTKAFSVKLSELQSKKRTNAIAYPRQIAMFLARRITRHSLEEVGGFFGGRDHSTVLYAVDKIQRLMGEDPETRRLVEGLLGELESPRA
jgi:chromosomal replication initiator protein